MRLVCISDTHGQHRLLKVPEGDVLIHAGDFSRHGEYAEVREFLAWFAQQPHPHKILVGGNHDFLLERDPALFASIFPDHCIYLNDAGTEIAGLRFWGSPVTPYFHDWAFNRHRGNSIRQHWNLIPPDLDVLITHGPPFGLLDQTVRGERVGCEDLLQRIRRVKPRLNVFGHIHEGYGQVVKEGTLFVNASVVDVRYRLVNAPVVLQYDRLGQPSKE